jgi:hypothetical protein
MLERVYWVETGPEAAPHLYRLAPERHLLEPVAWPDDLTFRQQGDPGGPSAPSAAHTELPVLPIPVLNEPAEIQRPTGRQRFFQGVPVGFFVLLVFDRGVIADTVFPELVQKYFTRDGELDYDVLIVDRDDPERGLRGAGSARPRSRSSAPWQRSLRAVTSRS